MSAYGRLVIKLNDKRPGFSEQHDRKRASFYRKANNGQRVASFSMYQWNFNTYKYKRLLFGVVLKTAIGPKATFSRPVRSPSIYFHRGVNFSDKSTRPGVSKGTCETNTQKQSNCCRTSRAIFTGTLAEFPNLIDQSKTTAVA